MPIYEYTCKDCGSQFDKFVRSMTTQVEAKCPSCGGTRTRKGWSVFGTANTGGDLGSRSAAASSSCSPGGT
jgi:putative FmdB family regulatory protein